MTIMQTVFLKDGTIIQFPLGEMRVLNPIISE